MKLLIKVRLLFVGLAASTLFLAGCGQEEGARKFTAHEADIVTMNDLVKQNKDFLLNTYRLKAFATLAIIDTAVTGQDTTAIVHQLKAQARKVGVDSVLILHNGVVLYKYKAVGGLFNTIAYCWCYSAGKTPNTDLLAPLHLTNCAKMKDDWYLVRTFNKIEK